MVVHCPTWGGDHLWEVGGLPPTEPLSSPLLDAQLAAIQGRIEQYYAGHRQSIANYDDVLATHRVGAYALRHALLCDGQVALRARLFRWLSTLIDEAADAAGVTPSTHPSTWQVDRLLAYVRNMTAGPINRARVDDGLPPMEPHAFLPGVTAQALAAAIESGAPPPLPTPLPPTDAHPAALVAAQAGIPWSSGAGAGDADHEEWREAMRVVGARIAERVLTAGQLRGRFAFKASLLRAYLLEHAEALYTDRVARLAARGVSDEELADAERAWTLSALDEFWKRHIAAMAVLRNSVNLRAFGLLEPLEEVRIFADV